MSSVIVVMKGGLGNQLFQYAFARNIQLKYGYEDMVLDVSELDGIRDREYELSGFDIPEDVVRLCRDNRYAAYSRRRNPLLKVGMHFCPKVVYDVGSKTNKFIWDECDHADIDKKINPAKDVVINGYWQSEKYFLDNSGNIKSDLTVSGCEEYRKLDIYKAISSTNSTCIHVRLGDYVNVPYYDTFGVEYYIKAIEYMKERTDSTFFVFSDDTEGARKLLSPLSANIEFVEYEGQKTLSDFFLMSQCKNFIMANSSYSWWAQYLGNDKDIVIAPKKWTGTGDCKDIYMDKWVLI